MSNKKNIGIYKITNPNGRVYIGQSIDIDGRLKHYYILHCKQQVKLYRSLKKYGVENHRFEVLELCNEEELNERERYYQEKYNCIKKGLNCVYTKTKDRSGKMSDETKKKKSLAVIGSKNHFYGKTHTKKTREIISDTNSKLVLDLSNGVYYKSATEAAYYNNINRGTLKDYLTNRIRNKTTLIYV